VRWTYPHRRPGRPPVDEETTALVVSASVATSRPRLTRDADSTVSVCSEFNVLTGSADPSTGTSLWHESPGSSFRTLRDLPLRLTTPATAWVPRLSASVRR